MAVAAEEYGLLICLAIVALFAVIVLRGFFLIFKDKNMFTLLAVSGLLVQFGMQALVNISSTEPDSDKGDDSAVYFLWRFFPAFVGVRDGDGFGSDAQHQ